MIAAHQIALNPNAAEEARTFIAARNREAAAFAALDAARAANDSSNLEALAAECRAAGAAMVELDREMALARVARRRAR